MPILIKGSGGAQKAPKISVNSNGLITATAGTKSATKQLSSSDDADFVAKNIRSGVNIFGVAGELVEGYLCSQMGEHEVGFERTGNTITLTIPLSSGFTPFILAIEKMRIGESESGSANKYRWCFSGVINFESNNGCWCMVNNTTEEGVYCGVSASYTHDGSNLIVKIIDEDGVAVMDEDATYFNDFFAYLFSKKG